MRILDLFAGLGGEHRREKVEALGHKYITLDYDPSFGCDITADIFDWQPAGEYDFIWASPPCNGFSVASIYRHWDKYGVPKSKVCIDGHRMLLRTLDIIKKLSPPYWLIENPRGMMRKCGIMNTYRRYTVTYCQYGLTVMKPTDLWGVMPSSWVPRPMCKPGASCHESARRGEDRGIQNQNRSPALRAIVPVELWLEVLAAIAPK